METSELMLTPIHIWFHMDKFNLFFTSSASQPVAVYFINQIIYMFSLNIQHVELWCGQRNIFNQLWLMFIYKNAPDYIRINGEFRSKFINSDMGIPHAWKCSIWFFYFHCCKGKHSLSTYHRTVFTSTSTYSHSYFVH